MKLILRKGEGKTKTRTGKLIEWPDGLYRCVEEGVEDSYLFIETGMGIMVEPSGISANVRVVSWMYERMDGYTGRITSITPEQENQV